MFRDIVAHKQSLFAGICLIFSAVSVGALAADAPAGVSQKGRSFHPDTLVLSQGTTLHIVNDDEFTHQAYVESPNFHYESEEQNPGDSLNITFTERGEFDVLCHIHPKMKLHVSVK